MSDPIRWTRKDYMDRKCTHRQYYGQFVTPALVDAVARMIGVDRINRSTDPHLNDIPLRFWDSLPWLGIDHLVGKAGSGGVSMSDKVCVMKEAAKQFKERQGAS